MIQAGMSAEQAATLYAATISDDTDGMLDITPRTSEPALSYELDQDD